MTLGIIMLLIILLQPGGIWAMYESLIDVRVAVQKESSVPEPTPILQTIDLSKSFGMVKAADAINVGSRQENWSASWVPTAQERPPLNLITGYLNPIGPHPDSGARQYWLATAPDHQARPGAFVSDSAALYGVERARKRPAVARRASRQECRLLGPPIVSGG